MIEIYIVNILIGTMLLILGWGLINERKRYNILIEDYKFKQISKELDIVVTTIGENHRLLVLKMLVMTKKSQGYSVSDINLNKSSIEFIFEREIKNE